ncbi:primosomal replication protein N [Photobacterium leiognathi]|uniref:Replication restart protein PriB n=3 Tax=Photobacterium leiognathi TaxID=553611 RepID=V5ENB6_PHOLE|nr:primosomal replication protein N [Photobacterium leiognathi]KJF89396.1 primosomal replication protein N [Photobacterium leiognathi]KJF97149.1 primosomal replication protein N [Photobacterium leiognathi]MCG3883493.1 primosomal replication protein N [Photobacterium leiognathi]PHZ59682.1 primosomal replication protein N [Photobacterium leiognathi]PSU98836.1 primosomal replication protein N [Photobacterium leiognathi subsp. mandapamensis]
MTNRLELVGFIAKEPKRSQSPAGISHCHFVLEHRSIQQEAGLPRQVYCYINVVVSGNGQQVLTQDLAIGSNVKVGGFISYQTGRNGIGKLVLHADHIDII